MVVDKRPREFMSKLFGKYEIVYRPLRIEKGKEIVEVYVERPLDGMKGVWIELISETVIKNNGFDNVELSDIIHILNDLRDLIYTDARDAANRVQKCQWRLNMATIIFTLTGFIILYERVHRWNLNFQRATRLNSLLMVRKRKG